MLESSSGGIKTRNGAVDDSGADGTGHTDWKVWDFDWDAMFKDIQSSAETYIRFIMNSIGGKTLSPDIIGTATISGAKLFLMKDLKLIYIFQDKLIIKFYFKVTKRNANLPFLSVNFPSVCSEITSQIVCKFLQIIVYTQQNLFF